MMSWNNVSSTYHYLDDFRSDDDEGLVRVGFTRSEGSLQIFEVGVSIRRCSWLSCCGDFDLFFGFVVRQDPFSSTLYFGGEGLQVSIAWGVPRQCFFSVC